jgi:hypothetical protein
MLGCAGAWSSFGESNAVTIRTRPSRFLVIGLNGHIQHDLFRVVGRYAVPRDVFEVASSQ